MLVVVKKVWGHVKPLGSSTTFWLLFLLGAKRITIINVVHFFKKRCLVAFVVRNLIVFNWIQREDCFTFCVFLGWCQYHGLEKRFSKVSYELQSNVERTYLLHHFGSKWRFTRPQLLQPVQVLKAHSLKLASKNFHTTRGCQKKPHCPKHI